MEAAEILPLGLPAVLLQQGAPWASQLAVVLLLGLTGALLLLVAPLALRPEEEQTAPEAPPLAALVWASPLPAAVPPLTAPAPLLVLVGHQAAAVPSGDVAGQGWAVAVGGQEEGPWAGAPAKEGWSGEDRRPEVGH